MIKNRFSKPLFGALSKQFNRVIPYKKNDTAALSRLQCCMCQQRVEKDGDLAQGEFGSVCRHCLMASLMQLEKHHKSAKGVPKLPLVLIVDFIADIENRVHAEVETKLVEMLYGIRKEAPELYKEFVDEFAQRQLYLHVAELLEHLPAKQWGEADVLTWVRASVFSGEYDRALACPVKEPSISNVRMKLEVKYLRICARLAMAPGEADIHELLEQLDLMKRMSANVRQVAEVIDIAIARCHYLLGNKRAARSCLEARSERYEETVESLLLLGDICADEGQQQLAKAHWINGLLLADRGLMREQLEERLRATELMVG